MAVFPRAAVVGFRDKTITAPEIGQQLNAVFVLTGASAGPEAGCE